MTRPRCCVSHRSVLQSTLMRAETDAQVSAIILAAGASTRMGRPKQLVPIDGVPMIRRTAETVLRAGIEDVVVVVGAVAAPVAVALAGLPVLVVLNADWRLGLSSSVQAGVRTLGAGTRAALLVLADQPRLRPDTLQAIVARYRATGASIVAPYVQGKRGNPVLFDRSLFGELLAVRGDQGGKALLLRHREAVERVAVNDDGILADVDTPEDLAKASSAPLGEAKA